jgi:protease-4
VATTDTIGRLGVLIGGALLALALGVVLFGVVPAETALGTVEVVLIAAVFLGGLTLAGRIAGRLFPGHNVAEVTVEGAITESSSGGGPGPIPGGDSAVSGDIVEQIERADRDSNVEALILDMNTPGGEVVASEDIRHAAEQFDGPTVAYATGLCASGGMWIASGCDEFHARRGSQIGSIGVIGANFGAQELLEKVGLEYRRFVAGDFKDTPSQFRDLREEEYDYFQGLLDDWYEQFVDTVVEGRGLDPEAVRETEARVYIGTEAEERGLVDTLGPRDEMESNLAAELGVGEIRVREFEPDRGLQDRLGVAALAVAGAFGRGVASVLVDDGPSGRV